MGASQRRKQRRAARWGAKDAASARGGGSSARAGAREGGGLAARAPKSARAASGTEASASGREPARDETANASGANANASDDDRRASWREIVVEYMSKRSNQESLDAVELAEGLRERCGSWNEETKSALGVGLRDFDRETLETLHDLWRRGYVECKDEKFLASRHRERLAFRRKFTLAKGVAEAMREMASSSENDEDAVKRGAGDSHISANEGFQSESEGDDHHDFDDSFDEYTDDEEENNFSFNLEENDTSSGDEAGQDEYDALHMQVVEFTRKSGMSPHEVNRRKQCFDAIESTIRRLYSNRSNCSLHVFGSGATGLALPGADLDLVLLGVGPQSSRGGGGGFTRGERDAIVTHLRKIARFLRKENAVSRAEIIATAKVPIIKMKSAVAPYIAVDLSLGTTNGLEAVGWIRQQVKTYRALKPLIFFLKRLLSTHHLNDAATGGCGGYLLVSLVVSHLKQTGTVNAVNRAGVLGDLLLGFLRRFGSAFDYKVNAIAAGRESGVMSVKDLPGPPFGVRPYIMAEDPQERLRCFTAAAHRFREVQNLFRLTAEHISVSGELSLLADVAAPPPRNPFSYPKGGQVIKVKQSAAVRRDGPTPSGKNNHSQHFRKANAKNSFSPNKPDWTDDPRNGNNKRPRSAGAWSSDGHKGHGGAPQAKRRKPPPPGSGKSVTEQMRRNVQAKVNAAKSARKKSGAISKKKANRARNRARKKK